jgi:hypothetical protein
MLSFSDPDVDRRERESRVYGVGVLSRKRYELGRYVDEVDVDSAQIRYDDDGRS